ncbi:MAG TPA: TetR/AcrR family transcriptional regulator [Candidatus Binatia bacterium]|jgi:AcrR family transcriptional regulator
MARARAARTASAKRGYHHGDLRRALIDTTLKVISEEDVAAVSLRAVARRAGVTYAAPYHHFRDKNALLAAVAVEGYRALRHEVERALARAPRRPAARLQALAQSYIRFGVAHPAHYRVMFRPDLGDPAQEPELDAAAGQAFHGLLLIIAELRGPGTGAEELERLAITAWSMVHGLVSLWNEGPLRNKTARPSVKPFADEVVRQLERLLTR